ncbi:MAG: AraC family transcriptional regulator [Pseudomonadales bacterium]|nr:AraC family transcriptional regulator [Pseudomonadales bacterium]
MKKNVVALNRDLRMIEEALLFPSGTKYTVFLSLDAGRFFTIESVKLKIDNKMVTSHVYSNRQRSALSRGGVQKLHVTNLSEGKHNVTAFFTGLGPNGRPYKRATTLEFDKGRGSQFLELAVNDDELAKEPVFTVKQW